MPITSLLINGESHQVDVDPDMPLLWVLRDTLGLTGTKYGCGQGLCGSCTIHLDGKAVRACITPVSTAAQKLVVTIEGLSGTGAHPRTGLQARGARGRAASRAEPAVPRGRPDERARPDASRATRGPALAPGQPGVGHHDRTRLSGAVPRGLGDVLASCRRLGSDGLNPGFTG